MKAKLKVNENLNNELMEIMVHTAKATKMNASETVASLVDIEETFACQTITVLKVGDHVNICAVDTETYNNVLKEIEQKHTNDKYSQYKDELIYNALGRAVQVVDVDEDTKQAILLHCSKAKQLTGNNSRNTYPYLALTADNKLFGIRYTANKNEDKTVINTLHKVTQITRTEKGYFMYNPKKVQGNIENGCYLPPKGLNSFMQAKKGSIKK